MDIIGVRRKHITESLEAISPSLQMLELVPISDDVLTSLASDGRTSDNIQFRASFPVTIAKFKETVRDLICERAKNLGRMRYSYSHGPGICNDSTATDIRDQYGQDVDAIHQALWQTVSEFKFNECDMGFLPFPKAMGIHTDTADFLTDGHKIVASYIARLGKFPPEIIAEITKRDATSEINEIIENGMAEFGVQPRHHLRAKGILVPADIDAVTLMFGGKEGTLHCSCEKAGDYTAFLYASRSFTPSPQ